MGRKPSEKPKCDHTFSVSKEAYDNTTELKNLLPYNANYDDIQKALVKCYTLHHKINLDGGNHNGKES